MAIVLTQQQRQIDDRIRIGKYGPHLVIKARAGTGKTTKLVGALQLEELRNLNVGFAAFNNTIADELKKRLPGAQAFTLHSFGVRLLFKYGIKLPKDLNKYKTRTILRSLGEENQFIVEAVEDLVAICKNVLSDGKDPQELEQFAAQFSIDIEPLNSDEGKDPIEIKERILLLVPQVLWLSLNRAQTIDYNDMILWPLMKKFNNGYGINIPKFDILFVDEFQDLNLAQQELAFRMAERLVIVGDDKQAMYAWRMAASNGFSIMEERLGKTSRGFETLPLTISWRCPKKMIELARVLVPDIEAAPNAKDGVIDIITAKQVIDQATPGSMIICRTNKVLLDAAYKFIAEDKRIIFRGRNMVSAMTNLIRRLAPKDQKISEISVADLATFLQEYETKQAEKLTKMQNDEALIDLHDRCGSIRIIMEGCDTVDCMMRKINALQIDDEKDPEVVKTAIVLSSVHRAKGLEADNVFILAPNLLPHPNARQDWAVEEEKNVAYVAVTRAKERLAFAGSIPRLFQQQSAEAMPIAV